MGGVEMHNYIYKGKPDKLDKITFTPGSVYSIRILGYGRCRKKLGGILGGVGFYKPLGNTYNVKITDGNSISLCAYSTKGIFESIWELKE